MFGGLYSKFEFKIYLGLVSGWFKVNSGLFRVAKEGWFRVCLGLPGDWLVLVSCIENPVSGWFRIPLGFVLFRVGSGFVSDWLRISLGLV